MSTECGWRGTEQEHTDFYSQFMEKGGYCGCMPRAHCGSSITSMTYKPLNRRRPLSVPSCPPQFHNPFPGTKKRCVLITEHWCNTQGGPPHPPRTPPHHQISMTSNSHSLREKHTPHSVPAAVSGFAKKSAGAYQTQPRLPYEPIAASQTGFKTNQTAKQHHRKSLPLSVSPLLSQKWFTPPKNRVFLHGWFEEAQVCCVFRANACVHESEGIVETITLNSAMGKE